MIFPKRKSAYSQAEISEQIRAITELQLQRDRAMGWNEGEVERCDVAIELAQKTLERMLEKVGDD